MKAIISLVTLFAFFCATPFTFAKKPKAIAAPTADTLAAGKTLKGKITAINEKAHTITLAQKKGGRTETISVHHASIKIDGVKHKHLSDLKVGMHAKVKHGKKNKEKIVAKSHKGKKKKK